MPVLQRFFISVSLIILIFPANAQVQGELNRKFFGNWSVTLGGGPNIFFGDVKVNTFWPVNEYDNEWRFAGTFSLNRQLSYVFSVRAQVFYGEIAGTKRNYKGGAPANLTFDGNIFEYNLNGTVNFSNLFARYNPLRKFFIYGTLGVGLSNWQTKLYDLNTHQEIGSSGSPGNWTTEGMLMGGVGAYVNIADKVNLGLEWTAHGVNSDKLDATVGGFQFDVYSLLALNVTYNFNKRQPASFKPAQSKKQLGPQPVKAQQPETVKVSPEPRTKMDMYDPSLLGPPVAKRDSLMASRVSQERRQSQDTLTPYERLMMGEKSSLALEEDPADGSGPQEKGITYRVQVFAYRADTFSAEMIRERFNLDRPVWKEFSEGWYRYTTGSFKTLADAKIYLTEIKQQFGVQDAFIARYNDGFRIPLKPKTYSSRKKK